ncbi:loki [Carabus blaptoides fortunei]
MSQSVDLTPSLTPRYADSLAATLPASPWGRLRPRRAFIPSVDLYNTRYVLGRDNNCDIHIDVLSNKLSKRHLVISRDETHVPYIEDLSRNGTYLNGRPLKECNNKRTALRDGDIISLLAQGNEVYQFKNESQTRVSDEFDSKYVLTRLLGQGAFGEVQVAVTEEAVNLIKEMLVVDPAQRVSVDDLLNHCWLWDKDIRHTYAMLSTNNIHRH